MSDREPLKVLIAGGGPAALEAALALRRLAGDRVTTLMLAPDPEFVERPLSVLSPFAAGSSGRRQLAELAAVAGAEVVQAALASVRPVQHEVRTTDGRTFGYDALLIAVGAVPRPAFRDALTFGGPGTEERMHGLVQDVEAGYVRRIAFVVPPGTTWSLPLYELALMTAHRAWEMGIAVDLSLVTPEEAPLGLFGAAASQAVRELLDRAGVTVRTGIRAGVSAGEVELLPGTELLAVDRTVTLPVLAGPALAGLPGDAGGFLRVDRHGRVRGVEDVYAAGDVTDFPVKQGGLACQQADAAAEAIAARAGAPVEPEPFTPVLRGKLLTERGARFLERDARGADGEDSTASDQALWWPPNKVAGRELGRHLSDAPPAGAAGGVEVRVPVAPG